MTCSHLDALRKQYQFSLDIRFRLAVRKSLKQPIRTVSLQQKIGINVPFLPFFQFLGKIRPIFPCFGLESRILINRDVPSCAKAFLSYESFESLPRFHDSCFLSIFALYERLIRGLTKDFYATCSGLVGPMYGIGA